LLRVILADVVPPELPRPKAEEHFAELARLIETLGGMTIVGVIQKRGCPNGKTYLGTGKATEVGELAKELKADAVVINGILKGNQYHELTQRISCTIWDRVDVILRIFERHAATAEAKLQIKRARLEYDIPKIYRRAATTLFERERGGGVIQRGAGETGIEAEKRHIREQIKQVDIKLKAIQKTHAGQRAARARAGLPTVAIVGYTNAGKSSLLRAITGKKVLVADKLFATLDTRLGSLWLPELQRKVLLADTIGFIENLPPSLIAAFKATLDEAVHADLILHVFDAAEPATEIARKQKTVEDILTELGCAATPRLLVANKIDLLKPAARRKLEKQTKIIAVSAAEKIGFEQLKTQLEKFFDKRANTGD
jgi:GTP-binding protein HflX